MMNNNMFEKLYIAYLIDIGVIKLNTVVINKKLFFENIDIISNLSGIEKEDFNKLLCFELYLCKSIEDNSSSYKIISKTEYYSLLSNNSFELFDGFEAIKYIIDKIGDSKFNNILIYDVKISKKISIEIYKKIVFRNIKLKELENSKVPLLIINNEKILLQNAVDEFLKRSIRRKK